MTFAPGATGKDGSQTLSKSAISSVDTSVGAVAFGPFKKGTRVRGFWLHGNTTLGFTPTACFARALRSLEGVALGSVTVVADGQDLVGGNALVDGTISGGSLAGCPVLLTGVSWFPVSFKVSEFPFIVVYFGGSGITNYVTVTLAVDEALES